MKYQLHDCEIDAIVLENWKPLEEVWSLMEQGQITVQDTLKIENALISEVPEVIKVVNEE